MSLVSRLLLRRQKGLQGLLFKGRHVALSCSPLSRLPRHLSRPDVSAGIAAPEHDIIIEERAPSSSSSSSTSSSSSLSSLLSLSDRDRDWRSMARDRSNRDRNIGTSIGAGRKSGSAEWGVLPSREGRHTLGSSCSRLINHTMTMRVGGGMLTWRSDRNLQQQHMMMMTSRYGSRSMARAAARKIQEDDEEDVRPDLSPALRQALDPDAPLADGHVLSRFDRVPNLQVVGVQQVSGSNPQPYLSRLRRILLKQYVPFPILVEAAVKSKGAARKGGDAPILCNSEGYVLRKFSRKELESKDIIPLVESVIEKRNARRERRARKEAERAGLEVEVTHTGQQDTKPFQTRLFQKIVPPEMNNWPETLLSFPGHISADQEGGRLFISDSNNSRIILTNAEGRVLDVADLRSRTLHTIYPPLERLKSSPLHTAVEKMQEWLQSWNAPEYKPAWYKQDKEKDAGGVAETRAEASKWMMFPCDIALTANNKIAVATAGYGSLCMFDFKSGEVKVEEVYEDEEGPLNVHSVLAEMKVSAMMMERRRRELSNQKRSSRGENVPMPPDGHRRPFFFIPYEASFVIAAKPYHDPEFIQGSAADISTRANPADGRVQQQQSEKTEAAAAIKDPRGVTNEGERLNTDVPREKGDLEEERVTGKREAVDIPTYRIRPGRCLVKIDVSVPESATLASPVNGDAVWRQGRGSLVELSMLNGYLKDAQVSMAQNWVDELDARGWSAGALSSKDAMEESNAARNDDKGVGVAVDEPGLISEDEDEYIEEEDDEDEEEEEQEAELTLPEPSPSGLPIYSLLDVSLGTGDVSASYTYNGFG
ncbi:hypothetical protein CBR_g38607 [Chara braunii]|uniref:Uncharacterized protein n=1 Tax=Chara braunii TaxID=69332 RepID=A0A388K0G4_CHABU|nr:hypothetical protein CBR_g38607 [Chara braunii]|eukprot:GBG63539.1 hypothetical protein CBR_g38607 [Chara braunii]